MARSRGDPIAAREGQSRNRESRGQCPRAARGAPFAIAGLVQKSAPPPTERTRQPALADLSSQTRMEAPRGPCKGSRPLSGRRGRAYDALSGRHQLRAAAKSRLLKVECIA